jgi:hypothetical protein
LVSSCPILPRKKSSGEKFQVWLGLEPVNSYDIRPYVVWLLWRTVTSLHTMLINIVSQCHHHLHLTCHCHQLSICVELFVGSRVHLQQQQIFSIDGILSVFKAT